MKKILHLFLLLVFPVATTGQPLLERPSLVTTDWLAANMDHPDLRVIDARPSLSAYMQGRLPDAIYLNTETVRISEGGVPARLLPPELLGEFFGKLGIGSDHTVVIYSGSEDTFAHATYIAFVLEWLGHEAVGVLDGGFEKWQQEERAVSREFPSYPQAKFVPRHNPSIMKTADEVREAQEAGTILLDARSPEAVANSHIPGAESFFLQRTLSDSEPKQWKSREELLELAEAAGYDGKGPVITYCTSGRESSQIWFTLRHVAGIEDVASYHGSLIDWTARGLPVDSGSE